MSCITRAWPTWEVVSGCASDNIRAATAGTLAEPGCAVHNQMFLLTLICLLRGEVLQGMGQLLQC